MCNIYLQCRSGIASPHTTLFQFDERTQNKIEKYCCNFSGVISCNSAILLITSRPVAFRPYLTVGVAHQNKFECNRITFSMQLDALGVHLTALKRKPIFLFMFVYFGMGRLSEKNDEGFTHK